MDYIAVLKSTAHLRKIHRLPKHMCDEAHADILCQSLYPSMLGFFEQDRNHIAKRSIGIVEGIIIAVHAGSGWYTQDGGPQITLNAGQMLLVPPHTVHSYGSSTHDPWTIYWCHLQGNAMPDLFTQFNIHAWHHQIDATYTGLWRQCLQLYQAAISIHQVRHASALIRQMLARSNAREEQTQHPFTTVLNYMDAHLQQDPSLHDFAQCAGLSKHHFSRQFEAAYACPPHRYFLALKINQAAQDLDNEQLSIAAIAARYGYTDQFYFSRLFKKITGYSPSAYRNIDKG